MSNYPTMDEHICDNLFAECDELKARIAQLEAERHAYPTCNHLATLLVNADACPLRQRGDTGCWTGRRSKPAAHWHTCADEDTADCVARIVAWEEAK